MVKRVTRELNDIIYEYIDKDRNVMFDKYYDLLNMFNNLYKINAHNINIQINDITIESNLFPLTASEVHCCAMLYMSYVDNLLIVYPDTYNNNIVLIENKMQHIYDIIKYIYNVYYYKNYIIHMQDVTVRHNISSVYMFLSKIANLLVTIRIHHHKAGVNNNGLIGTVEINKITDEIRKLVLLFIKQRPIDAIQSMYSLYKLLENNINITLPVFNPSITDKYSELFKLMRKDLQFREFINQIFPNWVHATPFLSSNSN
jgi:hypothetical protein